MFVDSDDLLADRYVLEDLLPLLTNDVDLVYYGIKDVPESFVVTEHINRDLDIHYMDNYDEISYILCQNFITRLIYKKDALTNIRFDETFSNGEDTIFLSCIIPNVRKAVYCEKICYLRRLHTESLTHSAYRKGTLENDLRRLEIIKNNINPELFTVIQ